MVAVPVYARKIVTTVCVSQLASTRNGAFLWVHDDKSPEQHSCILELKHMCDMLTVSSARMREHKVRQMQILHFLESEYEFLYLADNDSFHDPAWVSALQSLHEASGMAVSLYNTRARGRTPPEPGEGYELCDFSSGNSMLLTRPMAEIVASQGSMENGWEDYVIKPLHSHGIRFAIPRISLVEHYGGVGSVHYKTFYDELAAYPSEALQRVREEHCKLFYGPHFDRSAETANR